MQHKMKHTYVFEHNMGRVVDAATNKPRGIIRRFQSAAAAKHRVSLTPCQREVIDHTVVDDRNLQGFSVICEVTDKTLKASGLVFARNCEDVAGRKFELWGTPEQIAAGEINGHIV